MMARWTRIVITRVEIASLRAISEILDVSEERNGSIDFGQLIDATPDHMRDLRVDASDYHRPIQLARIPGPIDPPRQKRGIRYSIGTSDRCRRARSIVWALPPRADLRVPPFKQ